MGKKSRRVNRTARNRPDIMGKMAEDEYGFFDGTPILDALAELDEALTEKEGPDWVFSIAPDHGGAFMLADGDDYTLGPKARAFILNMRRIDAMIIETGREAAAAEAVAV